MPRKRAEDLPVCVPRSIRCPKIDSVKVRTNQTQVLITSTRSTRTHPVHGEVHGWASYKKSVYLHVETQTRAPWNGSRFPLMLVTTSHPLTRTVYSRILISSSARSSWAIVAKIHLKNSRYCDGAASYLFRRQSSGLFLGEI